MTLFVSVQGFIVVISFKIDFFFPNPKQVLIFSGLRFSSETFELNSKENYEKFYIP